MRILIVGKEGDGSGVAFKLSQEGHDVSLYSTKQRFRRAGKGMYKQLEYWRQGIAKTDLIICDMVGWGGYEERFREMGKPVLACSLVLEQTELDRAKGMQLFRACGIEIPPTFDCKTTADAAELVKKEPWTTGWVIKPCGNQSTSKTFVVKDRAIFPYCLSQVTGPLIVQEIVEGVEVSTEGWFNGRDWIRPFNHTFEEKCFMDGNLGPATGCQGNIVFAAASDKLTRATVERLKPFLVTIGYRGPVDINCIVNAGHAYALEISARMGYDAIDALMEGLNEPIGDLFFETAVGVKRTMDLTSKAMIAVRLSVPPWPHAEPKEEDYGSPVRGLTPDVLRHVVLCDVYRDGDEFFTAGGDGVILKATAVGGASGSDYTREATRRVYGTLDNIHVSGKQYRTDIGKRVNGDMKKLQEWGWL